jgi:hypothetical protein
MNALAGRMRLLTSGARAMEGRSTAVLAQIVLDGCEQEHPPSSSGSTLIAMVQTANLREGNDVAGRGRLYGTRSRAVLAETLAMPLNCGCGLPWIALSPVIARRYAPTGWLHSS